jgi:uncharacterized protein with gpF-like domain
MRFVLAQMLRRIRNPRRSQIVLRDIAPPATLATNLYRSCYRPVVERWQAAIPRIMAEYERALSGMTLDAPADVEREIRSVADELSRVLLTLTPRLRDWAVGVERWQRGKWRGAVLSATGIDLQTMIGPEDTQSTLETIIEWNTSLIKDVSDQARQRIANSVFSGLRERRAAREVAAEIREAVDMGRRRSVGIASDQLSKLSSSLASERRRQAGITSWKWRHSGKKHPREEHKARDGKVYTDQTAPKDKPGQLPYCGCREQAVIDLD